MKKFWFSATQKSVMDSNGEYATVMDSDFPAKLPQLFWHNIETKNSEIEITPIARNKVCLLFFLKRHIHIHFALISFAPAAHIRIVAKRQSHKFVYL